VHDLYLGEMPPTLLLGTHVSVRGGIYRAFERGTNIGCTTMQVFTKNSNQWTGKAFAEEDIQNYKIAQGKSTIDPVFAHAAYLINLCATNPVTLAKSRAALIDELERAQQLGLRGVIVHPGSHLGAGEEQGIERIAESINFVHRETPAFSTLTILETTAGQGTAIGYRLEHLKEIVNLVHDPGRVAVCIDTCHLFAAGYPIGTDHGWYAMMKELGETVGLSSLAAVHVNDSERECGSRVDRHEHIGKGLIGLQGFSLLMNDPRLASIPKILETEKSEDMHEDLENMLSLRSLIRT
jgi:deoxyribonuclease-4